MEIQEFLNNANLTYIVLASMIITALVKKITSKINPDIQDRILPAVSFLIGFILTLLFYPFDMGLIIIAIIVGGAGAGIYDFGKKAILNK